MVVSEQTDEMSLQELIKSVNELVESVEGTDPGTLEEYLRSLWGLISKHDGPEPTNGVIARLLADALNAGPAPFNDAWLAVSEPADRAMMKANPFDGVRRTLVFQLADMRRMQAADLLDPEKMHLGVTSPTGHKWNNFETLDYLDCAMAAIGEIYGELKKPPTGWTLLEMILDQGRVYE